MKHKVDILNLEWSTDSRDTNIVEPVLVSLEDRYGYTVKRESVWYGLFKILYYKPKILIMANDMGAVVNFRLFHFANKLGITTISLISEGLHYENSNKTQELEEVSFYGNNSQKERVCDIKLIWSEYSRNMFWKYVPETNNWNLKVSGGTGFDRYKLLDYGERKDLRIVEKCKKGEFQGVILLVGYGFDIFNHIEPTDRSKEEAVWLYNQRHKVKEIYKEVIDSNSQILFVLKHHPGSDHYDETEFDGIAGNYDNVIEIRHGGEIGSIIASCDMIVAFDSTVCLESWLLGKTTVLVNPESGKFVRSNLYLGSPILRSSKELNQCISEYFTTGKIEIFDKKIDERNKCIESQIQYADGLNHLRAARIINDYIKSERSVKKKRVTWSLVKGLIKEIFSEIKQFIIERTVIGNIKGESKIVYRQRTMNYNHVSREEETQRYRKAINQFEAANSEAVTGVLNCL